MDKLSSIFNIMDKMYPKHLRQMNDTLRQIGVHQNPYDDVIRGIGSPYGDLMGSLGVWERQFGINHQIKQLQGSLNNLLIPEFPTIEDKLTSVVGRTGLELLQINSLDTYLKTYQPASTTVQQALDIQRNLSLSGYLNEYDLFKQFSLPRSPVESLMKEISSMQLGSLQNLISSFSITESDYEGYGEFDDELENLDEEESEQLVNQAITSVQNNDDFSELSPQIKVILYKVLLFIFYATANTVVGILVIDSWKQYKNSSKPKISQMQSIFPVECLNRCRSINRNNAKLYSDPNRKSEVLFEPEKGTLLYVLDKEGKSWLKVQVKDIETDTVQIGWLMNSYTNRIRF
ncbi:SH3 domain-containing protein [Thalassotalea sp. 1_MG-2023]|uniref:SH3 domain-containing protein n=1 Tax=Thalassotalea sp. 1_MG-2023 TaxID=3062680 RepID=UPI0026E35350|nr:SH3 domain-containing protein [Thalassotalea sp. 1_MG-2023]MDO6427561.1 SH3 domain-containing protein [Thalassotalea sp. 1_MG-2023]